jgi:hypothetical protein
VQAHLAQLDVILAVVHLGHHEAIAAARPRLPIAALAAIHTDVLISPSRAVWRWSDPHTGQDDLDARLRMRAAALLAGLYAECAGMHPEELGRIRSVPLAVLPHTPTDDAAAAAAAPADHMTSLSFAKVAAAAEELLRPLMLPADTAAAAAADLRAVYTATLDSVCRTAEAQEQGAASRDRLEHLAASLALLRGVLRAQAAPPVERAEADSIMADIDRTW